MNQATPSMALIFRLILGVRFRIFLGRFGGGGIIGALAGSLLAMFLSALLAIGSWWLFAKVDGIVSDPIWMAFSMSLFSFLVGLFWVIWPVVAAQVDEAYEMERYFRFPVSPLKLYTVQLFKGLGEPHVLFFYPILTGAMLGLSSSLDLPTSAVIVLSISFSLMCVATGRLLLNFMLNIMTSRRSAEILFATLLLGMGLAVLIPPVDASWLFERFGGFGDSLQDMSLLANTAKALSLTPPGLLARGLAASAAGEWRAALGSAAIMLSLAGIVWILGLWLLLRFYRGSSGTWLLSRKAGGGDKAYPMQRTAWQLPFLSSQSQAVFEMEIRSLASNPKARMLFAVPFFLLIILKIVGAGQLLAYLWGSYWSAVLWSMLGVYVLSMMGGQILVNGFGYYSHAIRWVYWSNAPLRSWLVGRNLAHALFASIQFVGLGIVMFASMPNMSTSLIALPVGSFFFTLLCLLSLGNLLSAVYPRRFHFRLARRDRPDPASFLWMLATIAFCITVNIAILGLLGYSVFGVSFALWLLPVPAWFLYKKLLARSSFLLSKNKEKIIGAITK